MDKVIRLTEWRVKPRLYLLDDFIKSQCFDLQGNHIMPEDGGLPDEEIDSLRSLEVGDKVRLGDPSCTEIYVERLDNIEEFLKRETSIPPSENTMARMLRIIDLESEPVDTSLNDFLESNDGLTEEEIDALEKLELHRYYAIGVHFGWVAIQRIK